MRLRAAAVVFLLSFAAAPGLHATPIHTWSHGYGDEDEQFLAAAVADPFGNVVLCGSFYGTITFNTTLTSSLGSRDLFVAMLDPAGNALWSRRIGVGNADIGWDVATDPAGNVIAVGEYGPAFGNQDIVIAKYAPNGTQQWVKYFGALGANEAALAVTTDASSEIIVAGRFDWLMTFGGDTLIADSSDEIFLVKFDQGGNHLWSKNFGLGHPARVWGLETDPSGHIILYGDFQHSIDFGGGVLIDNGAGDLFLARFAANGDLVWSERYGGTAHEQAGCLAVGETGRVAIAASLLGAVDFGGGVLTPTGAPEPCVAVFTPGGSHVWSRNFTASAYGFAVGMTFAQNSDLLFSGHGYGTIDFGGGGVPSTGPFYNLYVARLFQADGGHRWSTSYAGDGNVYGTVVDEYEGGLILAGQMEGAVDFGGGPLPYQGISDVFAARFGDVLTTAPKIPAIASLEQNVPNPFNPETSIRYTLAAPAKVLIAIYDASGAPVARLDDGRRPAGSHSIAWNGRDAAGHAVASGVYFYRIEGVPGLQARKMVLLK